MYLLGEPRLTFNDYHKTCLYLATPRCNFKCVREAREKGIEIVECQNHALAGSLPTDYSAEEVAKAYHESVFAEALLLSGLDPLDCWEDVIVFLREFRAIEPGVEVVLYTGYYEHEVLEQVRQLSELGNVMVKFGRYDPSVPPGYDEVGGVTLASGNQHFRRLATA
jgi:hypothetical protein